MKHDMQSRAAVKEPELVRKFRVGSAAGLHARFAACIVRAARECDCEIWFGSKGLQVDAKSILGILMLGAGHGSTVSVTARGPDARTAMRAIRDLFVVEFADKTAKADGRRSLPGHPAQDVARKPKESPRRSPARRQGNNRERIREEIDAVGAATPVDARVLAGQQPWAAEVERMAIDGADLDGLAHRRYSGLSPELGDGGGGRGAAVTGGGRGPCRTGSGDLT